MSTFDKQLVLVILQFLVDDKGFKQTAHKLESESGLYFNMKYFEDMVLMGKWDDAENYLSGFRSDDDDRHPTKIYFGLKIYFELRKQKFLEVLDINDRAKALDILIKDLKVFSPMNEELFKEMTQLLTTNNIREHATFSKYGDANSARKKLMDEIQKLIKASPMFNGKLEFPAMGSWSLRSLLNKSSSWRQYKAIMDKYMYSVDKDLVLLVLEFLNEEGFKQTAHELERESGFFFDMKYFEDMVLNGKWDDAERYLSGFTIVGDNMHSTKIYFELRKQKFLEPLDINDRAKALDILIKDLKVFSPWNEELFKEMTQLLTINNIREHALVSKYGDANSARKKLMDEIKKIIKASPMFHGKLELRAMGSQRLRLLLNPSLNQQHLIFKDPVPHPVIPTLLVDHVRKPCLQSKESNSFECSDTVTDTVLFPAAQTNPETTVEIPDDPSVKFKGRHCKAPNETLKEDSPPISMDFHPIFPVLLVGRHVGNIELWDVKSGENLFSFNFSVWNTEACSTKFKNALEKGLCVSVKRIMWSPDGSLFGVAFSEHIVQLYSYHGGNCIDKHLEIDAHDGSVNDLAFSSLNQQLLVITCGDDMKIKVWDAITAVKCYTFEGHGAPVCSICPHVKGDVHFIFSTSIDGKFKAWSYDTPGARVDFVTPGYGYTKLAYSADDQRLLLCGSGDDGEPYLVEWEESEGNIKRTYKGLKKPCFSIIQFDSTKNRLLAAGDDHMVKFWDMDNVELLTSTDVNGELPEYPSIRFNKEGTLLVVAAKGNKINILSTNHGTLPKLSEIHSANSPSVLLETLGKNGCKKGLDDVRSTSIEESHNKSKFWNVPEICKPYQCQFLQLPVHSKVNKIVRLTYTNAGKGILALASNGTHILWKWPHNNLNFDGKATTKVSPQIWQPRSDLLLMTNDLTSAKDEDPVSCFALSKNDSYLMSTSGGIISLFNTVSFKIMTTIMAPPPMATCLAFYPQDNNIAVVGMDDSSILIYNIRTDEIKNKLEGHSKRVTALAFSSSLNVLVSGDVNAQILVWNTNGWGKQKDRHLQIHGLLSETHIQFHQDQIQFLVVHNTLLAIYEATELRCVNQWVPEVLLALSQATFSSDGHTVYACFVDGTLAIFDASNFQMHCKINPSSYLPTPSLSIYPVAIAAHPKKPDQFAVGLTDGRVYVFEPQKPGGEWSRFALDDKEPVNTSVVGVSGVR